MQAFQKALEVRTKADLPQNWATTEQSLGVSLLYEGRRSNGIKAKALLNQSLQAFSSVLDVYTKVDNPYGWARTMRNLSEVYKAQGNTAAAQQALVDANSVDPR